jgi:hypothetical protein
MKKFITILVSFIFFIPTTAQSSVILGSCKASQNNTTKTIAGVNAVCKSGYWYKVVPPVTVKPTPITTTKLGTPDPITVVTPTPTTASVTPIPTPTAIETPIPQPISDKEKAFSLIKSNKNSTIDNIDYSFTVGENFPKDISAKYQGIALKAMAYWDKFLPKNSKIDIYFVSEKDKTSYTNSINSHYPNSQWIIDQTISTLAMYSSTTVNYSTGGGTTQTYTADGTPVAVVTIWSKSTYTVAETHNDLTAHEITHAYQFLKTIGIQKQNFKPDPSNPGKWIEGTINIPCNLWEGTAALFGSAIVSNTYSEYINEVSKINSRVKNTQGAVPINNVGDMFSQMQKSTSWLGENCEVGYSAGAYIYEWMILNYGIDSYITLFDNIKLQPTFEQALQKTVNLSLNELYLSSKEYVFREYSR